ncbi:tyrosine-protein phosphatase non-receptor type 23-like [Rhopalosiphum maidis]|uniref:tyrosine-protein phosphatase non-receptor type 23-like n=1 Tax=Rhopalosiphum maidis TaxID=43146 RepID=UPI000EFDC2F5|nr:tyrosine-protein phosphatase non-receptor type 23-like [Rhopalosiphum maidis]
MGSVGSARHLLTVATMIAAIALCCAAAVGGGTRPSPSNIAVSTRSSILAKLPQPQLPKFPIIYTFGKARTTRPPMTNFPTLLDGKQQESQRPAPQQQQQPQQTPQPQKRPPKPTTEERPDGRVPYQFPLTTTMAAANASSVTTSPRPKVETTTQERSIITAPLKACPEGQRMSPDRTCQPDFSDPESDQTH